MPSIHRGRTWTKPLKRVKSQDVLAGYADLHRDLPCEWCWAESRRRVGWTDLHHLIGGTAGREDADWNIVAICRFHHQDGKKGFHGSEPLWDHERAFLLKREQGYTLPKAAWRFLPEGYDAGPSEHPDQEANRLVTIRVCGDLSAEVGC